MVELKYFSKKGRDGLEGGSILDFDKKEKDIKMISNFFEFLEAFFNFWNKKSESHLYLILNFFIYIYIYII